MKPTKRIRIPYNGPIYAKQGVYGPIMTPYREQIDVIQRMLAAGIPVVEVVDGREITLTLANYKTDFTKESVSEDYAPINKDFRVPVPSDFEEDPSKPEEKTNEQTENPDQHVNKEHRNKNKDKKKIKPDDIIEK